MRINVKPPLRYEAIARTIGEKIASGDFPSGSRLPAETELATLFEANPLTVRKALGILRNEGKVLRQQGRGTFVCAASKRLRSLLYVGDMRGHIFKERFVALRMQAQARRLKLFAFDPIVADGEPEQTGLLDSHLDEADAVIVHDLVYPALAGRLAQRKLPMLVMGDYPVRLSRPGVQVLSDRPRAAAMAVTHLAERGHRRIALVAQANADMYLSKKPLAGAPPDFRLGYSAYREALLMSDINDWWSVIPMEMQDEAKALADTEQVMRQPKDKRPTAFVCMMDSRARTLYVATAKLGMKIPDDFSIVGIGDTPWATSWTPRMTSINLGDAIMADMAIRYCLSGAPEQDLICRIEPKMVERQSVGAPA